MRLTAGLPVIFLTGQDYKAESITFTMSSDVDIAAQYRDAATDHTPDTAVCHPLTVTGGTATVEKDGRTLDIVPVVTGDKKTYSVPDGAKVTVTLAQDPEPGRTWCLTAGLPSSSPCRWVRTTRLRALPLP